MSEQQPVQQEEQKPQFKIILGCARCSVKITFMYSSTERKPRYCIYCGKPAEELVESR